MQRTFSNDQLDNQFSNRELYSLNNEADADKALVELTESIGQLDEPYYIEQLYKLAKRLGIPLQEINQALNAVFNTANSYSTPLAVLNFMVLFPEAEKESNDITAVAGASFLALGLASVLAELARSKQLPEAQIIFRAINNGCNAFIFVLTALVVSYVAIARKLGRTDAQINEDGSSDIALASFLVPSILMGIAHSAADIVNELSELYHKKYVDDANTKSTFIEFCLARLPAKLKTLLTATVKIGEHISNAFVFGAGFHGLAANLEVAFTGELDEYPDKALARILTPVGVGIMAAGANAYLYDKTNPYFSALVKKVEGSDILLLSYLTFVGMNPDIELSEQIQLLMLVLFSLALATPGVAFGIYKLAMYAAACIGAPLFNALEEKDEAAEEDRFFTPDEEKDGEKEEEEEEDIAGYVPPEVTPVSENHDDDAPDKISTETTALITNGITPTNYSVSEQLNQFGQFGGQGKIPHTERADAEMAHSILRLSSID